MEISSAQAEKHGKNYTDYKQAYLDGKESKKSLEDIAGDKRRCITLVHEIGKETSTYVFISEISNFLRKEFSGLYVQEIPHFTIDCHRYLKEPAEGQKIITPEEFSIYNQILKEEIGSLSSFPFKVQGVSFGNDGLVAQVWYNPEILIDFNDKLGKKVRAEVPSMDFEWGMAKGKVPIRVVNLARFTGEEDKGKVERFVEHLKGVDMREQDMKEMSLLESDHYIQKKNTKVLGRYLLQREESSVVSELHSLLSMAGKDNPVNDRYKGLSYEARERIDDVMRGDGLSVEPNYDLIDRIIEEDENYLDGPF